MKYIFFLFLIFLSLSNSNNIIVDSNMTFDEAVKGTKAPQDVLDDLVLTNVEYYGFDGFIHKGQLVLHKDVEKDILDIFDMMKKQKFPVEKCIPIVKYDWSDDRSMADNNTSAFNFRYIAGTKKVSNHSYGIAIDINPVQNPAVYNDGKISPESATYKTDAPGTLTKNNFIVKELKKRGWRWGGDWTSLKDYQHFDKPGIK